jgi:hypothetical protein
MAPKCDWQEAYKAAMLELNPKQLPQRIRIAQAAIRERAKELMRSRDRNSIEERWAVADALSNLALLERTELRPAFGVARLTGNALERGEL